MKTNRELCAIILAAGKGSRMKEKDTNKTALLLAGKPIISYAVNVLKNIKVSPILIVVGHAKESVKNALKNAKVTFIDQSEQLGTGDAAKSAVSHIPDTITDVIIIYGDDSFFYKKRILQKIIGMHIIEDAALTFLTINVTAPVGLGRVIRDKSGEVIDIIEEKDATDEQRKIKEINPNCYVFKKEFLIKYLSEIPKSKVTGEYYLPALIKIARAENEKIVTLDGGELPWKGINTREDLEQAKSIYMNSKKKFFKNYE